MVDDMFWNFKDMFTIVYLDGTLIFSKTQEEHDVHVH